MRNHTSSTQLHSLSMELHIAESFANNVISNFQIWAEGWKNFNITYKSSVSCISTVPEQM